MSSSGTNHTCLNCSNGFTGNYCNVCGEKVYKQHDKNLLHLVEEVFHFITHLEGTLFTTLKTMFKSPGQLSQDFCRGVRKKYFRPVSLFILLVVIYLILPMARGLNMPLSGFTKGDAYSYAKYEVNKKMSEKGMDYKTLETKYNLKSEKVSKFLLLIVLPLCALLLALLFYKNKFYFFDHFILSAEIASLFLMVLFILLPILVVPFAFFLTEEQISSVLTEDRILLLGALIISTYCFISFRRFYHSGVLKAIAASGVFALGQLFIILVLYKKLLFFTVMSLI